MKIVIQYHLATRGATGYDVFVKKSIFTTRKRIEKLKQYLGFYDLECYHTKQFLKKHPDYIFIGAEDTNHIESLNESIEKVISDLRFNKQALFVPAGFDGDLEK
jgi:2'-5' RNA ligase